MSDDFLKLLYRQMGYDFISEYRDRFTLQQKIYFLKSGLLNADARKVIMAKMPAVYIRKLGREGAAVFHTGMTESEFIKYLHSGNATSHDFRAYEKYHQLSKKTVRKLMLNLIEYGLKVKGLDQSITDIVFNYVDLWDKKILTLLCDSDFIKKNAEVYLTQSQIVNIGMNTVAKYIGTHQLSFSNEVTSVINKYKNGNEFYYKILQEYIKNKHTPALYNVNCYDEKIVNIFLDQLKNEKNSYIRNNFTTLINNIYNSQKLTVGEKVKFMLEVFDVLKIDVDYYSRNYSGAVGQFIKNI
jgi:hypothetical protein